MKEREALKMLGGWCQIRKQQTSRTATTTATITATAMAIATTIATATDLVEIEYM
jgi:hypothetical protein